MTERVIHDRLTAQKIAAAHVFREGRYNAISKETAKELLCPISWELLQQDAICNNGPTLETLYPWNVVDYLSGKTPKGIGRAAVR